MQTQTLHLAKLYPGLATPGADPTVTIYLQQDFQESDCKGIVTPTPRPALIICPGGGFTHCSQREAEPIVLAFASLGMNCFVLNYSVAPCRYPQALRELTALVDLLWNNARDWNIDTERIVLCGFSAGGYLAASYCTLRDRPEITEFLLPHPIRAAILGYPVISAKAGAPRIRSFLNLLGVEKLTEEQIQNFSLENHVRSGITPPTFLWHTAADSNVFVANALTYADALGAQKIPFELHIFPFGRHGLATSDRQTLHDYAMPEHQYVSAWVDLARNWLKQIIL